MKKTMFALIGVTVAGVTLLALAYKKDKENAVLEARHEEFERAPRPEDLVLSEARKVFIELDKVESGEAVNKQALEWAKTPEASLQLLLTEAVRARVISATYAVHLVEANDKIADPEVRTQVLVFPNGSVRVDWACSLSVAKSEAQTENEDRKKLGLPPLK